MIAILLAAATFASPFSDGCVLQRDRQVEIWGEAAPGEKVELQFGDVGAETRTGDDGRWRVSLPPMPASCRGRELKANSAVVRDVVVGEVWLASGQSNMAFAFNSTNPRDSERSSGLVGQLVRNANLRLAKVRPNASQVPLSKAEVVWRKATPEELLGRGDFSAVAFYYGKMLQEALSVPVGVIEMAVGATSIDAWMPAEEFAAYTPSKRKGNDPLVYFNGMVNPVAPYSARGFIWYQGERNSDAAEWPLYRDKLASLFNGWRRVFRNPSLTMRMVQIVGPVHRSTMPHTQCQQARFADETPGVEMCVVNDVGNPNDIHPNDKETVARRLAALSLKHDYGMDIAADSPAPSAWCAIGRQARLTIANAKRLHLYHPEWMYRSDPAQTAQLGFELAGEDGEWRQAEIVNLRKTVTRRDKLTGESAGEYRGELEGMEIVLKADGVVAPKAVRYLFRPEIAGSVYNEASLPMGPFVLGAELTDRPGRVTADLGGEGWTLTESDGRSYPVSVPHCWNIDDACDGREVLSSERYAKNSSCINSYERKRVVYSRKLPPRKPQRRYFIRCLGASITATVKVNGKTAGSHLGAFTAFCFEITDLLSGGENLLEITVDNFSRDDVAPPVNADFNMHGGLYRGVELVETPMVCIDPVTDGASGVRLYPDPDTGKVRAEIKVLGGPGEVREFSVKDFKLWSPETPVVYTQRFEIASGDAVVETFGFRKAEFRKDGFYLNGKKRFIRGVNYHQDLEGKGWAISKDDILSDIAAIKELGADGLRTAHYQHSGFTYSLCDEQGLLVWCEQPNVNGVRFNDEFRANCWGQTREMVAQLGNHPSIICWSIFNELYNKVPMKEGEPEAMMEELRDYVSKLDPSRPVASACSFPDKRRLNNVTEVFGFNRYPGWYGFTPEYMKEMIDEICTSSGRDSFGMTEFGAGGSVNQHGDAKTPCVAESSWHTEEYQAYVHVGHYRSIVSDPRVWGAFVWCMFDFGSDRRLEGEKWGRNDKGLVTYDRKEKKDSWYFYRANWSGEKTLRLVGSRKFNGTTNETLTVMGFSNLGDVELKVNGRSLGVKTPDKVCTAMWENVPLELGTNEVVLVSGGLEAKGIWRRVQACNFDESKIGEVKLESPLVFADGRRVANREDWNARRREILGIFQREMYGRMPEAITPRIEVIDRGVSVGGFAERKLVRMRFKDDGTGPCVNWIILTPRHAKGKSPALLFLNYGGNHELISDSEIPVPKCWMRPAPEFGRYGERATAATRGLYADHNLRTVYPVSTMIVRGFAVVSACYTEISPDWHGRKLEGNYRDDDVLSLFGFDPARKDNPTALGAWAWALMRAMDMLEGEQKIDAARVTVAGSSRLGKAALIAGAFDERFYAVVPNQTGGGGVPLMKRNYGENAECMWRNFPHWFSGEFAKYVNNEKAMKFDSHLLLSCVAPRRLLVEGFDNPFYDARGEFEAVKAASPVWEFLGEKGLPVAAFPEPYDTGAIGPRLGYVRRTERHGFSAHDWMWLMDFVSGSGKCLK